jgi:hypothetical protein
MLREEVFVGELLSGALAIFTKVDGLVVDTNTTPGGKV